jgi:HEAT repeat protein
MPLVRASDDLRTDPRTARAGLSSDIEANARRVAALASSGDPSAVAGMVAQLATEKEPGVREAIFASLVATGGTATAHLIAPLMRSNDASLRGAVTEALKQMAEDAAPALDILLADADPDVRLLAIEVTRAWPVALAVPRLKQVFMKDPHVNVCCAAVDVATEVGNGELVVAMVWLRARFPDEPFLGFAVDIACSRIHSAG